MSHSPGMWKFHPDRNGSYRVRINLGDHETDPVICSRAPWDLNAEESWANGRLIAAAPDLLWSLDVILERVELAKDMREIGLLPVPPNIVRMARAALAKAKGE